MAQSPDLINQSVSESDFQRLLSSNFVIETTTPADVSGSKAARMVRLKTTDLFFKGIRPNFDKRGRDFLCDLICANLGQYLHLPVLPQIPIKHSEHGLGLVSPYLDGETGIAVNDPSQLVNGGKVSQLCVFEEWVMNTDDKSEHFRTVEQGGEKKVYAFDHGHSLHQANDFGDEIDDNPQVRQSVGNNPYGYETVSEVEQVIELIEDIQIDEVRHIIRRSLEQIRRIAVDDTDIEALVNDADSHTATVTDILCERQKHIDRIMESKFE